MNGTTPRARSAGTWSSHRQSSSARRVLCATPSCRHDDERTHAPGTALPGLRLCRACRERLRHQLTALPGLYNELGLALTAPASRRTERVRGGKRSGTPLNEAAADARSTIRHTLAAWAGLVVEQRGTTAPNRGVAALADFLDRHLDWLAAHEAVADLVHETHDLVRSARRAARPDPTQQITLGACVEPSCPGVLNARLESGDTLLPAVIVCTLDHSHTWPPSQWHRLRRRMQVPA